MPRIAPELNLSEHEQALLQVREDEVARWLEAAKAGDVDEQEQLYFWAYLTARNYYGLKVYVEKAVSVQDAEELTTLFFLEFERSWPRMRSVTRYTQRMLKNNLKRYLQRKKHRLHRETPTPDQTLEDLAPRTGEAEPPWQRWSDTEWRQYQTVLRVLEDTDEKTRAIIMYRLESPPCSYKEIAESLEATETSVRMRVTRFYQAVRRRYVENT